MLKIALVNMPFSALQLPSLALTQLRCVLAKNLDGQVECDICYLNQDFLGYFGREAYLGICSSVKATASGLGDWLFRQVAFPEVEDNATEYLQRYGRLLRAECELLPNQDELRSGLDAFFDRLIDLYQLDRCSAVGFTSMFAQNVATFAMARKLKERNPDLVTVMGGATCETSMGRAIVRNVEAIDFVFSGPSLKTFPRFVQYLMHDRRDKCHEIAGVLSKQKLDRDPAAATNEIGEKLDIDEKLPLDYDGFLISLEEKCPGTTPALPFETSRGCWWGEKSHCTFCGLNDLRMHYTAMSPQRALEQFEELFRYGSRVSRFQSVDNILPREYLSHVLPHVKPPENACIFYEVKANLKEHEMQVLADAGVTEIQPGIESLATSTLRLMRKGTTAFQNLQFLKNCSIHGIVPGWNLLIGFPGEGEKVYEKYAHDLPLLVHLHPPTAVFPVRFDRFSHYYTSADEYGLKLKPYDFYAMVYPFPEKDLEDMAYFFADHNYENAYIANTGTWIKKLEKLVQQWHTRWHRRDGKLEPRLVFEWRGNAKIVLDTRRGTAVTHEIEPLGLRLLECLAEPSRRSRLPEELANVSATHIDGQLDALRQMGLIFQEKDRYMSLVIDSGRDEGYL